MLGYSEDKKKRSIFLIGKRGMIGIDLPLLVEETQRRRKKKDERLFIDLFYFLN